MKHDSILRGGERNAKQQQQETAEVEKFSQLFHSFLFGNKKNEKNVKVSYSSSSSSFRNAEKLSKNFTFDDFGKVSLPR